MAIVTQHVSISDIRTPELCVNCGLVGREVPQFSNSPDLNWGILSAEEASLDNFFNGILEVLGFKPYKRKHGINVAYSI